MMHIIGLYSAVPQSGKTTVSRALANRGYERVSFAATLKGMLIAMLTDMGYTKAQAAKLAYVDKETVLPALGVTPRYLLQTLGTEWGRTCISSDLWLRVWQIKIQHKVTVERRDRFVVDDVRFANEAELVRSLGGEVWKVVRTSARACDGATHVSEGGLESWPHFTRYIENDGSLEELLRAVAKIPLGKDGTDSSE